jgi:hypothetical protein
VCNMESLKRLRKNQPKLANTEGLANDTRRLTQMTRFDSARIAGFLGRESGLRKELMSSSILVFRCWSVLNVAFCFEC